jgi:hypothetical protein
MGIRIGLRDVCIAAVIGAGAASLLDAPPVLSATLGVLLVPLVAAAAGGVLTSRPPARSAESTPRGVCDCGHPMSMHCHGDCSGPCAAPDCRCAGLERAASTQ